MSGTTEPVTVRQITRLGTVFPIADRPVPNNPDFWDGATWEDWTYRALDFYCPAAGLLVDIGAWIGPFTCWHLARTGGGAVIAYEADPVAFQALLENLALNPDTDHASPNYAAAWDECRQVVRLRPWGEPGDSRSSVMGGHGPGWHAPSVRLDCALGGLQPAAIKIDVEGAEIHVLEGLRQTIERARPTLLLSLHEWALNPDAAVTLDWLATQYPYRYSAEALGSACELDRAGTFCLSLQPWSGSGRDQRLSEWHD